MNLILKDSTIAHSRVVSPWTGLYFLQSLLINLALGYPLSLLYSVTFTCILMLLWRSTPRAQKALTGICPPVAAIYFLFGQAYGSSNSNTLLVLRSAGMEESTEILTIFSWYSYLVGAFIFAFGVIAVRHKKDVQQRSWNKFDSICLPFSVVALFVAPVQSLAWGGVSKLKGTGYPVFHLARDVIVNNNEVLDEQKCVAKLSSVRDSQTVTTMKPKYHTYVVVIGEGARRNALGAFDGHWDNAPFTSSVNGYLFTDYIATGGSTQKSLGSTLSRVMGNKPQFQGNFVTLANRAGFQTWWSPSQGQIGEYGTAIANIMKRAGEVQFLKSGDFEADKNTRDEMLLKMTTQVLATGHAQPQLVVLHLMGLHPQVCDQTQGRYETSVQSKETPRYLYTMTQTGNPLHQLYEQLRNNGSNLSMVYFFDYGLAFKGRGKKVQYLAHNDQFRQNFQVPFMVLSGDDKAHRVIKARRSTNDFLSFLSRWTGISTKEITNNYRLISGKEVGSVYITNFKLQKVGYNCLSTDIFSVK